MVSLGLMLLWHRHHAKPRAFLLLVLVTISLGLAAGSIRLWASETSFEDDQLSSLVGQEVSLTGIVTREPEVRDKTTHAVVQIGDSKVLLITDRYAAIDYGDQVNVAGQLMEPESFTTDLGKTFDYPGYLKARGINYTVLFGQIDVVGTDQGWLILSRLYDMKARFKTAVEAVLPEPASGLGLGVLLGIKQALGEELEAAFRTTGLVHIIVLSGYNVMLIVTAVMFVLASVFSLRSRVLIGVVAIVLFAILVGLSATVVRASIMAVLVLLTQFTGSAYHVPRALCLAGAIMLLVNPYLLVFDIGFQLSFMATLGLVVAAPHFETAMSNSYLPPWREFLWATIATQIAVAPLLLFHIGQLSLIAVVVNVIVLPFVPWAMAGTALAGLAAVFNMALGQLLAWPAYFILSFIIKTVTFFAAWPLASITVPVFPAYLIPIAYAAIVGVWFVAANREYLLMAARSGSAGEAAGAVAGWTIEEESRVSENGRGAGPRPSAVRDDTPIFFR